MGEVTTKESLESIVAHIKAEVGYINLLVNNAGIIGKSLHNGTPLPAPFVSKPGAENYKTVEDVQAYLWEDTMEDWDDVFRVNTTGAWFASVAFLGLLAEGNKREVVEQTSQVCWDFDIYVYIYIDIILTHCKIVTVVSIGAFSRSLAVSYVYNASKAAMTHVGKMMATNLAQFNIRSVCFLSSAHAPKLIVCLEHDCSGP